MNKVLKIFSNERIQNNYIYLPADIANLVMDEFNDISEKRVKIAKIKKMNLEKPIFLGYLGGISNKENSIELSSKLCDCLNLRNGEIVKFSFDNEIKSFNNNENLISLNLVPLTNYDYKIIEMNSEYFEENLLNQIMVVFDGLIFPFIFYDHKISFLRVNLETKNKSYVISQDCEINVAFIPEEENEENKCKSDEILKIFKFENFKIKYFPEHNNSYFNNLLTNSKNNFKNYNSIRLTYKFLRENKILANDNILSNEKKINQKHGLIGNVNFKFNDLGKIISHLSDSNMIYSLFNFVKDPNINIKTNEEILNYVNEKIFSKFSCLSNLWVNIEIDDTLNEEEIILPEFYRLLLLYAQNNETVNLHIAKQINFSTLKNFEKKFQEGVYINFLKENLKIEFCFSEDDYFYNDLAIPKLNLMKELFFSELYEYINENDMIILNLGMITQFKDLNHCNIKKNIKIKFLYRFTFKDSDVYNKYFEMLNFKLKINFCKLFNNIETEKEVGEIKPKNINLLKNNILNENGMKEENKINFQNFIIINENIFKEIFVKENIINIIDNKISAKSCKDCIQRNQLINYNTEMITMVNYSLSNKCKGILLDKHSFSIENNSQKIYKNRYINNLDNEFSNESIPYSENEKFENKTFYEELKDFEKKLLFKKDISSIDIILNLIKAFYNNKTSSPSICFLTRPKNYNFYDFSLELKNSIESSTRKNINTIYLDFSIFLLSNYHELEAAQKYLECFFNEYVRDIQVNDINKKMVFILENFNLAKFNPKSEESNMSSEDKFNKNKEYRITQVLKEAIKSFTAINKILKNKCYIIFSAETNSSNLVEVFPSELILNQNNFDYVNLPFLDNKQSEDILRFIINIINDSHKDTSTNESEYNIGCPQEISNDKFESKLAESKEICKNFVFYDFERIFYKFIDALKPEIVEKNIKIGSNQIINKLNEILENYTSINNLSNDKLIKLTSDFSDIGGLHNVKSEISDTILLSMKCSELFNNRNPIKLSTGILLIGPPGCGKTLIASTIQKQFKINFFSIKGPEILNKYIGASEAAVREIFENAKKAIPCVIFLDEFDSIAPKRGSGSSGVTDRVIYFLIFQNIIIYR